MKRIILTICALILIPLATNAATIYDYGTVTTYSDGSPIPAALLPLVTYRAWYTASPATGPWTAGETSKGATLTAPDPAAGSTGWYSVSAFIEGIDGSESVRSVPASKTVAAPPVSTPAGCSVR